MSPEGIGKVKLGKCNAIVQKVNYLLYDNGQDSMVLAPIRDKVCTL
jgi:hypothetical protein